MDKRKVFSDVAASRSGEGSPLLDLNTGFFLDPGSSVSAPSIDLHQSRQSVHMSRSEIVVEYTEVYSSTLAPPCHSANGLSPSLALQVQSPLTQERTPEPNMVLTVPMETRSSTPREGEHLKKHALASSLDLSCIDLTVSQPSWELSLIKHASDSPHCTQESSLLDEPTWSPKCQSAFPSLAEISSLIWSGTPPQTSVSTESHKPWRETVLLGLSQTPSVNTSDHWQKHTSVLLPCAQNKDLSVGSSNTAP
ncbi:hypothetical protein SKAU_G00178150 [Synaphobranchus kaupii]|uniref:Uncharacterized protein n=1 Tax=Synaphobranchus kaupii TaxID=118154 RepID=A0A9Q1J1E7_SYNKA|nr:hypothetical protein SKAU_G00178150 [Synaphobranchus kaupii]